MLDFYRAHGVSPVKQDIGDLQAHFARRAHLYRSLGLWPNSIQGKSVLEVGPGSGQNALYTLSLNPRRYVLVEPNEKGRGELEATLRGRAVEINRSPIEDYASDEQFDVVICEGVLGLSGKSSQEILNGIVPLVACGGVLVVTCIDAISDHSEVLRRALAQRYINRKAPIREQVETLKPIFAPHLATLKGMTRSVEDWIIDNILNPASIGPTFSIPDALTALEGRFEVLGCNPRFLMDWRWYKEAEQGNAAFIEAYWRQAHNLIDYRTVEPERSKAQNQNLLAYCMQIREDVAALERGEYVGVGPLNTDTGWFGRGQQYLSLVRTHAQ